MARFPRRTYAQLAATVAEERTAADAALTRLTARVDEIAGVRANLDVAHETLRRLAELRSAIAERVSEAAGDIGALRVALAAVCAEVRINRVEDGMVALDYFPVGDDWTRIGLTFDVLGDHGRGSGVPL